MGNEFCVSILCFARLFSFGFFGSTAKPSAKSLMTFCSLTRSKIARKVPTCDQTPPKSARKVPTCDQTPPKSARKVPTCDQIPPKSARKVPTCDQTPPKSARKVPTWYQLMHKQQREGWGGGGEMKRSVLTFQLLVDALVLRKT